MTRKFSPAEERTLALELKENPLFWHYLDTLKENAISGFASLDDDRAWVRMNEQLRIWHWFVGKHDESLKRPDDEKVA